MLKPPTDPIDTTKPVIPVPETVLERALKRVQAICKGNGIKADDVTIVENNTQIYEFPARTSVRLTTLIDTKTVAGKITKGEMIGSPEAFQGALQTLLNSAKTDGGVRKTILDTVLNRPDKGFSARDQKILIPTMAREFVSHEPCSSCSGKGKNTCHSCGGKKMSVCGTCQGRSHILCPNCRGTGHIMQNGKRIQCPKCRTKCRIACPACGARGQVACSTCKGSGELSCVKCSGTGSLSHIAIVNVEGHLHFDYERQGLPLTVGKRIDAFGARHAAQKDFLITPLNTHVGATPIEEPSDIIFIDYNVKIPHGKVGFALKTKTITATILGYRGEILDMPPFLNDLTRAGQNALMAASNDSSKSSAGLKFAAKFKLLRDVILLASKNTDQRSAISILQRKYPFGVTTDGLLSWFIAAQNAVQYLTRRPRWVGLGIGLVISTLILSLLIGLDIRNQMIQMMILSPMMIVVMDSFGWLVCWLITAFSSKLFVLHQIRSTLSGIVPMNMLSSLSPSLFQLGGRTTIYAMLFSLLLVLLVYGFWASVGKLPEYAVIISSFLG